VWRRRGRFRGRRPKAEALDLLLEAGSAGQSALAAPADHVHPIASNHYPYVLGFSDLTEQSQAGPAETLVAQFPVAFAALPLGSLVATLAAAVEVDSAAASFT